MVDERWFTVQEIVDLLKIHEETVRRWVREGRIIGRNFGGKTGWRVRERDLNAFLEGNDRGARSVE